MPAFHFSSCGILHSILNQDSNIRREISWSALISTTSTVQELGPLLHIISSPLCLLSDFSLPDKYENTKENLKKERRLSLYVFHCTLLINKRRDQWFDKRFVSVRALLNLVFAAQGSDPGIGTYPFCTITKEWKS